jgi:hypothetical protein
LAVLVTLTVGLVWWIAAWALGVKAFDAILLTMLMVVVAATARIYAPLVRKMLGKEKAPLTERSSA